MPMISHPCKTCGTMLTYNRISKHRSYCPPCKVAANRASDRISLPIRRKRYGGLSMKKWRELEREDRG